MRKMRKLISGLVIATLAAFGLTVLNPPAPAAADVPGWDPGYIISDANMYTQGGMSEAQIQSFLNTKGANCSGDMCLKNYRGHMASFTSKNCPHPVEGGYLTAAQMIYRVSQACQISAKVILVTLEKENSLVSRAAWKNSSGANGFKTAMGYGCPDFAACDAEYFGIGNQIFHAAKQLNNYRNNPGYFNFRGGKTSWIGYNPNSSCGGSYVYIKNAATAGLYNYTPYQPNSAALAAGWGIGNSCSTYGNRNFYNLYRNWFGDPRSASASTNGIEPQVTTVELKPGDTGAIVNTLQKGLQNYFSSYPRFTTDSTYGHITTQLVKMFQKEKGLAQTGNVDTDTSVELINESIPVAVMKPVWSNSTIGEGTYGQTALAVQMAMATVANAGWQDVKLDASYGGYTKSIVKNFQIANNLEQTGYINMETSLALVKLGVPIYVSENVSSYALSKTSSSSAAATALQMFAKAKYPQWFTATPDSIFGGHTEAFVKKLQASKGLKVTGIFDYETYQSVKSEGITLQIKPPVEPPKDTIIFHNVSYGDSGDQVLQIQRMLAQYYPQYVGFTPDGYFGQATREVINKIQEENGISPDGIFGRLSAKILAEKGAPISFMFPITVDHVIDYGEQGETALNLQKLLVNKLPQWAKFTPDGFVGAKTKEVIALVQKSAGLPETGILDAPTSAVLRDKGIPFTVTVPNMTKVLLGSTLKRTYPMSSSTAAWTLQKGLTHYFPRYAKFTPDGYFGGGTQQAVKSVQSHFGLNATGEVDAQTALALYRHGIPLMVIPSGTMDSDLTYGSSGDAVYTLQWAGKYFHPEIGDFTPDGYFGGISQRIVKAFQADAKLPQTGVLDRGTYYYLKNLQIPLQYN